MSRLCARSLLKLTALVVVLGSILISITVIWEIPVTSCVHRDMGVLEATHLLALDHFLSLEINLYSRQTLLGLQFVKVHHKFSRGKHREGDDR